MIVAGQLVVIEATRFPHGGCIVMTMGSRDGLEDSGIDREWTVMLAQHDITTPHVLRWPSARHSPKGRFTAVLEKYLEPA